MTHVNTFSNHLFDFIRTDVSVDEMERVIRDEPFLHAIDALDTISFYLDHAIEGHLVEDVPPPEQAIPIVSTFASLWTLHRREEVDFVGCFLRRKTVVGLLCTGEYIRKTELVFGYA